MNKTELVEKIAATAGLTKTQAEAAVNAFVATVTGCDGIRRKSAPHAARRHSAWDCRG